ncbi:MAG: ATP-binding protein [Herpetosiphon sp.]
MDERLRQRDYLLRIGKAITARLDLETVLSEVIEYAVAIVAGNYGMIALHDRESDELAVVASYNLPQSDWGYFDPLLRVLLDPHSSPDDGVSAARSATEQLDLPLRQMVSLPLMLAEAPIGIIVVFRAALNVAFTRDDQALLQAFADQAAVAVQNARLYAQAVRERERVEAIIEGSADGVMILDNRWRITTFNRAMEHITGWPREEAIGRPCSEVVGLLMPSGERLCLVACPLQAHDRQSQPIAEGWMATRDGRKRFLQTRYSPTWNQDGSFGGAIANVRDITTQRYESEQQLTFVSVLSHELKTPVAIIKGYASTLGRPDAQWDRATLNDGLLVIEEEADRLNQLITNLLDVSRLQSHGLRLVLAPFALPPLVERIIQGISATAGQNFEFELRFDPAMPSILGDEERIRMVITNLLTNAVKYSPQGGTVRVGGWKEDDHALVYVADQGIGIAPEDQERIFERFYRVEDTLSRTTQGVGLGLFLAKAIVEAHGGTIAVESQLRRGSRFVLRLPIERPQLADTDNHVSLPAAQAPAALAPPVEPGSQKP